MSNTHAYIDGREHPAASTYPNIDPATGKIIGEVARCGPAEVDVAASAAHRAQPAWAATPPAERGRVLMRIANEILDHREELAQIETEDTGKPLSQARVDVDLCARYFEYYGRVIDAYFGIQIPLGDGKLVYTRSEPYGVVGQIFAWNYPLQIMARAVAPALAVGNATVSKPADETPRSTVRVAELAVKAGLPAGVFNVVTGLGAEAGAAISAHSGISHLSFVGSTETGRKIAHAAAERVVPTVLELGGKSAQIVFADADLDRAADAVVKAILQNAGQTCSAGSRLVVERSIHAEFVERVTSRFATVTVGPGASDPDVGPLISAKQLERVRGFMAEVPDAEVTEHGIMHEDASADGAFQLPVLVDNVDPNARIAQEEVFGPVLAVIPFDSEEEAIAIANGTRYGLLGAVWTRDIGRAQRAVAAIRAGQVYVNNYGAAGGVELPFGGFGESGYGREKGYEALDSYTATKTAVVDYS